MKARTSDGVEVSEKTHVAYVADGSGWKRIRISKLRPLPTETEILFVPKSAGRTAASDLSPATAVAVGGFLSTVDPKATTAHRAPPVDVAGLYEQGHHGELAAHLSASGADLSDALTRYPEALFEITNSATPAKFAAMLSSADDDTARWLLGQRSDRAGAGVAITALGPERLSALLRDAAPPRGFSSLRYLYSHPDVRPDSSWSDPALTAALGNRNLPPDCADRALAGAARWVGSLDGTRLDASMDPSMLAFVGYGLANPVLDTGSVTAALAGAPERLTAAVVRSRPLDDELVRFAL